MHIAIIGNYTLGQLGNGQGMTDAALAADLAARGDRVTVLIPEGGPESLPKIEGCEVVRLPSGVHLGARADAMGADVLLLSAFADAILPRQRHLPICILAHDASGFDGLGDFRVFANGVVCAGDHYAGGEGWPPHIVVHPPDSEAVVEAAPAAPTGKVVLSGVTKAKGIETLIACAKALPDLPFAVIRTRGSVPADIAELSNVEVVRKTVPEAELIAMTRVGLAPSQRESYGMAARLIAAAGKPVIVNDLPAFRESCGDAAVYIPRDDHPAWVEAIRTAWDGGKPVAPVPVLRRDVEIDGLRNFLAAVVGGTVPAQPPPSEDDGGDDGEDSGGRVPRRSGSAPDVDNRPLLIGFLKVRDEIAKGNLHRVLNSLAAVCDFIAVVDDGSIDGTWDVLRAHPKVPSDLLLRFDRADFVGEIRRKQRLLEAVGDYQPRWVLWLDGDEVLDAAATEGLRRRLVELGDATQPGAVWSLDMREVNLWMSTAWRRVDDGLDDGMYRRVWRWAPDLHFGDMRRRLHSDQCPAPLRERRGVDCGFTVLHYGNADLGHLRDKAVQYVGSDEGEAIRRHVTYDDAAFAPVAPEAFPPGAECFPGDEPAAHLTGDERARLLSFGKLEQEPGLVVVAIPAFDRAETIGRAIESVQAQTYDKWLALVLDDGSSDGTADVAAEYARLDPRVMVLRYPTNRGGVAVNEIGMTLAAAWGEFWARLGSDDWWTEDKLANDIAAFDAGARAVFGPYRNIEDGEVANAAGNPKRSADEIASELRDGRFAVGWANVAVRTEVLRAVHARWGHYVDPRLRNMEDYLFNVRVARLGVPWTWRPGVDGVWVVNREGGASYKQEILAADGRMTQTILAELEATA